METIADFGTVSHFGVQTFATGIYRAWFSLGDRAAAAQLGLCLLGVALALALFERAQRGYSRYHDLGRRREIMPAVHLSGWRALMAFGFCGLPVLVGFVLPVVLLVGMGVSSEQSVLSDRYIAFIRNSVVLAGTASLITVAVAVIISFNARLHPGREAQSAMHLARIGYAVPGGVIAVGLLVPFAAFDNAVDAWMQANLGISTGLILTGSISLLVMAYVIRFLAAGLGAFDSGLSGINPHVDSVSRTLGCSPLSMLRSVHLPLLKPSVLTALLIVFVDVMKELPATLIMRPFNFDTLAVQAYRLAADERLAGAAVPSLIIVAVGLLPVLILCRRLGRR
jgi:iron(III) transport system permease protein